MFKSIWLWDGHTRYETWNASRSFHEELLHPNTIDHMLSVF